MTDLRRRIFRASGQGAYLFVLFGLVLHTSKHPVVLHKYSLPSAAIVLAMAALFLPYAAWVRTCAGYFLETRTVRLPDGRTRAVGPGTWAGMFVAAAGLIVLSALAAGEAWLRTAPPEPIERFHPFLQGASPRNDPALHTNRYGFRGEEIVSPKPPGEFRVFVLGGSTAFCERLPYEQNPARLLEQALRARYPGRDIRVWNAGYLWYTSEHSLLQYLTTVKDLEPDMIVMWHGINDLIRSFSPPVYAHGEYRADYGHFAGPAGAMVQERFSRPLLRVRLLALEWFLPRLGNLLAPLYSDLREARRPPVAVREFPSLAAYRRNLESFAELCRADCVALVVGTQPSLYRPGLDGKELASIAFPMELCCGPDGDYADMDSMIRGMGLFNDETRAFARRHGIPLADLEAEVPKNGDFLYDDCHFTERGGSRVAEVLARTVIGSGLLEKPPAP